MKRITHTCFGIGGGGVWPQDLEVLFIRGPMHHLHRSQKLEVFDGSTEFEHAKIEVIRCGETLRLWDIVSPWEGQCGGRCFEPQGGMLTAPGYLLDDVHYFTPAGFDQEGLGKRIEKGKLKNQSD